jgi:type VI secretion system secreted protein Hcp
MAVDMFLELKGIAGESQDATHKGKIDVLAWSWGASNSGSTHMGGGSGAGKANFQDISITKYVDIASPILALHCANGKHIPEGKLIVRKAGEKPLEYMLISMKDILISSFSMGGSGGEDRLTENISLNFGAIHYQFVEQDATGKASGKKPEVKWDIAANEAAF